MLYYQEDEKLPLYVASLLCFLGTILRSSFSGLNSVLRNNSNILGNRLIHSNF